MREALEVTYINGDVVQVTAYYPDYVKFQITLPEIIAERNRFTGKRLHHDDTVPYEVRQQQPTGKNDNRRIGAQFTGIGIEEVLGHGCSYIAIEKAHEHTGGNGDHKTFDCGFAAC